MFGTMRTRVGPGIAMVVEKVVWGRKERESGTAKLGQNLRYQPGGSAAIPVSGLRGDAPKGAEEAPDNFAQNTF